MTSADNKKTQKNAKAPVKRSAMHPMLLLVIVVVLCAAATYILPAGTYQRVYDESLGRDVVDPGSFLFIERAPASVPDIFLSFTRGMQSAADVIFFLLIIGGMFGILNGTGALNVALANLMRLLRGREALLIPVFMLLFGCGSAFCGNFEEFLVFIPLVLACCITAGYDSLTAVGIIFLAATAGYGGSLTNAFTVGLAQQISGLPLYSGMGMRVALFLTLEAASILYVLWYAAQIRRNPQLSGAYIYDVAYNQDKRLDLDRLPHLKRRQFLAILVFLAGVVFAVWGMIAKGFYVDELSAVFLATGIVAGAVGGLRPGEICEHFIKGCHDMLLPGLMIGLANSAVLLLQEAYVMDTILHSLATMLTRLPDALRSVGMFFFHDVFNVIVPSGSAQATITMPLMAPLADASGMTRQTAVLAYQLGDAFTNVLAPTGGEILAALAFCKVPFGKWVRFLLPIFAIWCAIAIAFLVSATRMGYGPF